METTFEEETPPTFGHKLSNVRLTPSQDAKEDATRSPAAVAARCIRGHRRSSLVRRSATKNDRVATGKCSMRRYESYSYRHQAYSANTFFSRRPSYSFRSP